MKFEKKEKSNYDLGILEIDVVIVIYNLLEEIERNSLSDELNIHLLLKSCYIKYT